LSSWISSFPNWSDLAIWSDVVAKRPNNRRARNNLGRAYFERQRLEDAIVEFRSALEIDPGWSTARLNLGRAYLKGGMPKEAALELQRVIDADPRQGEAYGNLAAVSFVEQDWEAVSEICIVQRASMPQLLDSPTFGYMCGIMGMISDNPAAAEQCLRASLSSYKRIRGTEYPAGHALLGALFVETGGYEEALRELDLSLKLDPGQPMARGNLALAYGKSRKLTRALRELESARIEGLSELATRIYRGIIFRDNGLPLRAEEFFRKALELGPTAEAFSQLGQTYASMGRWRRAEESYRTAWSLERRPRDLRFLILALKSGGRDAEAARLTKLGLRLFPANQSLLRLKKKSGRPI